MCYTIFYRAMFVKLSDGTFIPMVESGDNNVWEESRRGRWRRSREWCDARWRTESDEQRKRFSLTEDEIIGIAQRQIDIQLEQNVGREPAFGGEKYTKEYVTDNLGFFSCIHISGCRKSSAKDFVGFFRSGLRNAVEFGKDVDCLRLSWWEGDEHHVEFASSEAQLAEKWKEALRSGHTAFITLGDGAAERAWLEMKSRNRRQKKEKKDLEDWWVVRFDYYGSPRYVVKKTSRNTRFTPWSEYAHKYTSRSSAESCAQALRLRCPEAKNVTVINKNEL